MRANEGRIELNAGIEASAGEMRESDRLCEQDEQMRRMFDDAWGSLSLDEQAALRQERDDWLVASRGRAQHGG